MSVDEDCVPEWLKDLTVKCSELSIPAPPQNSHFSKFFTPTEFLIPSTRKDETREDPFQMATAQSLDTSVPSNGTSHLLSPVPTVKPSFPILHFDGHLHYLTREAEVENWCRHIPKNAVLGFDTEWKAVHEKGSPPSRTALIQFCFRQNQTPVCLLIHISVCGISPALQRVLISHEIKKVGTAASGDARKLKEDYDIDTNGVVDLEGLVQSKDLSSCIDPSIEYSKTENSLVGLCERLLNKSLTKRKSIRCGNWEAFPLREIQKRYAAADAFASLLCYEALVELPERSVIQSKQQVPVRIPPRLHTEQSLPRPEVHVVFVPEFKFKRELCHELQIVYNLFMGCERVHLAKHSINMVAQLSCQHQTAVHCNLADAILAGQSYDWHRMEIKQSSVKNMAAALLKWLDDPFGVKMHLSNENGITGHPLAQPTKHNDFDRPPLALSVFHLSRLICREDLADWETTVIDFRRVLSNSKRNMQEVISLLPEPLPHGMQRNIMAHIGRLVTDFIHKDSAGCRN